MDGFCDNSLCENKALETVRVSVRSPGDQERELCAPCEEVFTWGVQHGTFQEAAGTIRLDEVLYALTVEDLVVVYEEEHGEGSWPGLGEEEKKGLIRRARRAMESICGEGVYSWADGLAEVVTGKL